MKAYIGITDLKWFKILRNINNPEEINFWQPSGKTQFRALNPGELFLFKLHSPNNYIVGGGIFAHSTLLPISLAWEAFGKLNGANNLNEMRNQVEKYRNKLEEKKIDYIIGCILLEQPFFLPEAKWIPVPNDWKSNIVQGRSYDLKTEPGIRILDQLNSSKDIPEFQEERAIYGEPILIKPRLGQGSFRIVVTDAYERRCAITNEKTLPALDAAHIKPYTESGIHSVRNGLLLRKDLHALFDKGYLTITPQSIIEISRSIKEEFENGRDYYQYHGRTIHLPTHMEDRPSIEFLEWHNQNIYKG